MTYDEMITAVEALNTQQQVHRGAIPHGSNLLHQFNKKEAGKEAMYEDIFLLYMATRNVPYNGEHLEEYVSSVVEKTNDYMGYFWPPANNPFSHQADFTSSIIPEMFCTIFGNIIRDKGTIITTTTTSAIPGCGFPVKATSRMGWTPGLSKASNPTTRNTLR